MKVLGSTGWRAFSSGCGEMVHLRVHTGWKMERFDNDGRIILGFYAYRSVHNVKMPKDKYFRCISNFLQQSQTKVVLIQYRPL